MPSPEYYNPMRVATAALWIVALAAFAGSAFEDTNAEKLPFALVGSALFGAGMFTGMLIPFFEGSIRKG